MKSAYRELYNEWVPSQTKQCTAAGSVKPPDKFPCLELLFKKGLGEKMTKEVVVTSFKACVISRKLHRLKRLVAMLLCNMKTLADEPVKSVTVNL